MGPYDHACDTCAAPAGRLCVELDADGRPTRVTLGSRAVHTARFTRAYPLGDVPGLPPATCAAPKELTREVEQALLDLPPMPIVPAPSDADLSAAHTAGELAALAAVARFLNAEAEGLTPWSAKVAMERAAATVEAWAPLVAGEVTEVESLTVALAKARAEAAQARAEGEAVGAAREHNRVRGLIEARYDSVRAAEKRGEYNLFAASDALDLLDQMVKCDAPKAGA